MWTVAVGLAYLPGIKANLGLVGLWIGMALDEVIRAIIFIIRWKKVVEENQALKKGCIKYTPHFVFGLWYTYNM